MANTPTLLALRETRHKLITDTKHVSATGLKWTLSPVLYIHLSWELHPYLPNYEEGRIEYPVVDNIELVVDESLGAPEVGYLAYNEIRYQLVIVNGLPLICQMPSESEGVNA